MQSVNRCCYRPVFFSVFSKLKLKDFCFFWDWNVARNQVRWMTAWDMTEPEIDVFVAGVRALLA